MYSFEKKLNKISEERNYQNGAIEIWERCIREVNPEELAW